MGRDCDSPCGGLGFKGCHVATEASKWSDGGGCKPANGKGKACSMQQTSDPVGEPIPPPSTVSHNQLKQALVGASTHRLKSSTGRIDQSGAHLFGGIGINGRVIEVMSRAEKPSRDASLDHPLTLTQLIIRAP